MAEASERGHSCRRVPITPPIRVLLQAAADDVVDEVAERPAVLIGDSEEVFKDAPGDGAGGIGPQPSAPWHVLPVAATDLFAGDAVLISVQLCISCFVRGNGFGAVAKGRAVLCQGGTRGQQKCP
jgi:hypothetical protein